MTVTSVSATNPWPRGLSPNTAGPTSCEAPSLKRWKEHVPEQQQILSTEPVPMCEGTRGRVRTVAALDQRHDRGLAVNDIVSKRRCETVPTRATLIRCFFPQCIRPELMLGRVFSRPPPVRRPTSAELDDLPAKDRQELWDAHRQRPLQTITALITTGGVLLSIAFTAFGLIYTARTLATAQQQQITERYSAAVQQLASPTTDVRLGGIYALERITVDSPRDRLTIRNVLASFVRNHDLCTSHPPAKQCSATIAELGVVRMIIRIPPDVYAALTIASSITSGGDGLVDFSGSRFPRAELSKASLSYANLTNADLTWANLEDAVLKFTNLSNACLTWGRMAGVDLRNANLSHAELYGADLTDANLSGADLRGADLRHVFGMTPDEIRGMARTDSSTEFKGKAPEASDCGGASYVSKRPLNVEPGPLHPVS